MRARNLKPGFFDDEILAELGPYAQLLFEGLWCLADRDGKLEDRPARIKAHVFPYYDPKPNVITLLDKLCQCHFIQRYSIGEGKYIKVLKFKQHQNPHPHEAASKIPDPIEEKKSNDSDVMTCNDNDVTLHGVSYECNADSLILKPSDSLILKPSDSLNKERDNACARRTIPPDINSVIQYCKERNNGINPQEWFDHYSAKGWMIGKSKMVDWRAAVRTWENKTGGPNGGPNRTGSAGQTHGYTSKAANYGDGQPFPCDLECTE